MTRARRREEGPVANFKYAPNLHKVERLVDEEATNGEAAKQIGVDAG